MSRIAKTANTCHISTTIRLSSIRLKSNPVMKELILLTQTRKARRMARADVILCCCFSFKFSTKFKNVLRITRNYLHRNRTVINQRAKYQLLVTERCVMACVHPFNPFTAGFGSNRTNIQPDLVDMRPTFAVLT